jgi:cysteine desulfurase
MREKRIYFDNASTTPVDPRVTEVMLACFTQVFGNPSSMHSHGTAARELVEKARTVIAGCVNAVPGEIFFTSGGTESNNWALKGLAFSADRRKDHIIVSAIEHDCILNTCKWLRSQGFRVSVLPVESNGIVDPAGLKKLITPGTFLISVMHASNEIGTIQPIREIGTIAREAGVLFHTDACQTFGKLPVDVEADRIDLMTINAHKIGGPKGAGALYIRKGVRIEPLLHGGGQEQDLRSTTENVPGIVGFATAAGLCMEEMATETVRLSGMRRQLVAMLEKTLEGFYINGHAETRLPGLLNFAVGGLEGEGIRLLLILDEEGISVSTGSACSSNSTNHAGSHVLKAIGRNPVEANGAIRVSLGRNNTMAEILVFRDTLLRTALQLKPIFST